MKALFIEARKTHFEEINKEAFKELPKELFIAYSIQFKELAERIKSVLNASGYNIIGIQQVLGCSKLHLKQQVPILLVGSGRFHALNLVLSTGSPIYIYNSNKIEKITERDILALKQKKQGALSRFLSAESIGILVSTKPGQNHFSEALKLKNRLESKKKKVYLFVSNSISTSEFENFKIDSWVNTACPGLAPDNSKIINSDELSELKF